MVLEKKTIHKYTGPFLFCLVVLLFFFNQWLEIADLSSAFMRNYLDDLLLLPIFLSIVGWIFCKVGLTEYFRISLTQVVIVALYFIIVFEIILPLYFHIGISDPTDALMYLLGGAMTYMSYKLINPIHL